MRIVHNKELYSSGTITGNGNTGVIATPITLDSEPVAFEDRHGQFVIVPLHFTQLGADMTVDETATVTVAWYTDATGGYTHGTTTFAAMTWTDADPAFQYWPGTVTGWDIDYTGATEPPNPPWIPLPPYCKITWVLAGAAKSMSFTLRMTYLVM